MKVDVTFLRSKVARRIFTLFVLCALLPIAILAILSFRQVTKQLDEQSRIRLRQATKATGMALFERLLFLEGEMLQVAANTATVSGGAIRPPTRGLVEDLATRFIGLTVLTEAGRPIPMFGRVEDLPPLSAADRRHLSSGKTLVSTDARPGTPVRVFMSLLVDPREPHRGILMGEVNAPYLWGTVEEGALPPLTELCVLDQSSRPLFCSPIFSGSFAAQAGEKTATSAVGQYEWSQGGKDYLISYWSLFLRPRFFVPKWTVVLGESKAAVLAPMEEFKKIFPLVILLALWVVLLLSVSQIRRSLVPLEKLQEGTTRVAQRDFETRVTVTSGDEFEDLAKSFNVMAGQLGRQFHALRTIAEIDQAILGTLDTRKIVDTLLTRMRDVFRCDAVSVTLLDAKAPFAGRTSVGDGATGDRSVIEAVPLSPGEIALLRANPEGLVITDGDLPGYLDPLAARGITSFLVLPIFLKERLAGIIALGHRSGAVPSGDDVNQARQLADQVAVALSNARLVEELADLNWGTLTALARAIDAKSPWTAGHSERVTNLALRIARAMGLSQWELDTLHRGGLLHDIGKIGTPPEILDKPGRLTPDEANTMRHHVRIGARILEPIAAYADVIPVVLHHHEWFDGTGYPDGLAGEAISLGARIFAVADCFDALVSDRPYRAGMERERVVEIIKQGAGRQFDPTVVQAFLEVMSREEPASPPPVDARSLVLAGQDA
ncbi:MAG TPA: HD domain-containing phosphohydrolase [Candidatus Methylomirabilis sp.]|nr:HD domain-containing phosphohydrolase [Candidatus Methylomirabilis sp.]